MADTITSASVLKLEGEYVDNDTNIVEVDNPKDNITAEQINAVATVAKTTQVILGDKGGAAFNRFKSAHKLKNTRINLDLR